MHPLLSRNNRIVIKIGAPLIADEQAHTVRTAWLDALCRDIKILHDAGKDICIVSSGAIALGSNGMPLRKHEDMQAAASQGQIKLASAYDTALRHVGIIAAQNLLTRDDIVSQNFSEADINEGRNRCINARNTFNTLFGFRAIPVVNENDTVSTEEIRAGDNDVLAVEIAEMIGAGLIVQMISPGIPYTKEAQELADQAHIPVLMVENAYFNGLSTVMAPLIRTEAALQPA